MNTAAVIVANIVGWPVLQLGIAGCSVRIRLHHFANSGWSGEAGSREIDFYRSVLRIRKWKRLLPDGGPWVGGKFQKRRLQGSDEASLRRLVAETRRGEAAHWVMLGCSPVFFLWNPVWAGVVLTFYGCVANLPCIVVQRYNRQVALKLLCKWPSK